MYLLDTNIWLERLLGQERSDAVGHFLNRTPTKELFITDFAFHSICVILDRLNKKDILIEFVHDLFIYGDIGVICLNPTDIQDVVNVIDQFNLDFDDAYQYVASDKYNLELISYDSDYDKTLKGRKKPEDLVK